MRLSWSSNDSVSTKRRCPAFRARSVWRASSWGGLASGKRSSTGSDPFPLMDVIGISSKPSWDEIETAKVLFAIPGAWAAVKRQVTQQVTQSPTKNSLENDLQTNKIPKFKIKTFKNLIKKLIKKQKKILFLNFKGEYTKKWMFWEWFTSFFSWKHGNEPAYGRIIVVYNVKKFLMSQSHREPRPTWEIIGQCKKLVALYHFHFRCDKACCCYSAVWQHREGKNNCLTKTIHSSMGHTLPICVIWYHVKWEKKCEKVKMVVTASALRTSVFLNHVRLSTVADANKIIPTEKNDKNGHNLSDL